MDKKDLLSMFQELRIQNMASLDEKEGTAVAAQTTSSSAEKSRDNELCNRIEKMLNHPMIDYLDIKRIFRYLDKNVKKDFATDDVIEEEPSIIEYIDE
jgi:hypothetical protein